MVARKEWTRRWFDAVIHTDRVVTSAAVIAELESGDFPGRDSALMLLANLELLRIDTAVAEIVAAYDKHKIMPKDPFGDALHLALASYHRCANARKFGHIRRVNGMLGLFVPELVTPMELLGEDWDL